MTLNKYKYTRSLGPLRGPTSMLTSMLRQANALSLEGAEENSLVAHIFKHEDNNEQDAKQEDGEEDEEELMRQAIALSLEGAEEEDDKEE